MPSNNKIKITQKDFDDIYEIETPTELDTDTPKVEDKPEFLSDEEQQYDTQLKESLQWEDEA